jgi:hypothetical protein
MGRSLEDDPGQWDVASSTEPIRDARSHERRLRDLTFASFSVDCVIFTVRLLWYNYLSVIPSFVAFVSFHPRL